MSMRIPASEYSARIEKVRNLMRNKNIDAAFIYHDELYMCNGCYLTNYWPTIESGAVLVPIEGEPLLLGGPEAIPYADEVSMVKEKRSVECFIVPEEEYPGAVIHSMPEIFHEAMGGRPLQRVGVVGYSRIPFGIMETLTKGLPSVEFVDLTRDYVLLRAIKSESEISVMAKSFEIGNEGLRAAVSTVRPGATEFEIAGAAEGKMRRLGADGFNFRGLVGSGVRSNGVVPPASGKRLQSGELVLIGFSPKVLGYAAGVAITVPVDNPPTKAEMQFVNDLVDTLELTRDSIKPGLKGKEIDAIPRQFLTRKGYGDYLSMGFVHTVGLNEYELPFFGPNSDDVLEENMTVCIDIAMFNHPVFHGARHEAGYVVRSDGAKPLSQGLEDLIFSLRDPRGVWSQRSESWDCRKG